MLITAAGMGLSLIFHVLIPRYLGGSETADALIAALKVVLLVDTIFREGAKFSLVPLFINEEKQRNGTDFQSFTNSLLNFLIVVGVFILLLIEVFATWIANGLLSSRSVEAQSEMAILLRLCAPLIIFGCGSTVLGAFLNSQKHFKTVALRNALPPGIATLAFLLLSHLENLVHCVAVSYACGFMVYFVWLCIGMHQAGHRYRLTWVSLDTLRSLKDTITLPTLGFAIRQTTARLLVDVFLVGRLGEGAITLYNSAFRIFSAIQTLIGISIATTGLPDMAADKVAADKLKLKRILLRNIRTVLYIAIPVTVLLLFGSTIIAQLLFRRSKFDESAIQQIAQLLFWLSTGTVFSCLIPVLNAGLYAQKAYGFIFRNMVTMAILNFAIAYGLVIVCGLQGVALTVSSTAVLAVGNLIYLLRKTGVALYTRG
jgi:peptidoglycan biosynthesis protein MviN/MurJ (putative lipid II flippase)